jgi:hypothetical protein
MSDEDYVQSRAIPEHDVRKFLADSRSQSFTSYDSLETAGLDPDSAVVLSGDWGGTIFLTVPVRLLRCSLTTLDTLVSDLDAATWMSGRPTVATVELERHPVGSGVVGGDGGVLVIEGVWTHPTRLIEDIRSQAADVILGVRPRIDAGLLRATRQSELERKREFRLKRELRRKRANRPLSSLPWDFDIAAPAVPFE